ncbi:MAG: hypothetical protein K6B28_07995 [Lachnospiraceae bacterium]|nr:hypothetical protein [Lachnospiraceae bacterium]
MGTKTRKRIKKRYVTVKRNVRDIPKDTAVFREKDDYIRLVDQGEGKEPLNVHLIKRDEEGEIMRGASYNEDALNHSTYAQILRDREFFVRKETDRIEDKLAYEIRRLEKEIEEEKRIIEERGAQEEEHSGLLDSFFDEVEDKETTEEASDKASEEFSEEEYGTEEFSAEELSAEKLSEEEFGTEEFGAEEFGTEEFSEEEYGTEEFGAEEFGAEELSAEKFGKEELNAEEFNSEESAEGSEAEFFDEEDDEAENKTGRIMYYRDLLSDPKTEYRNDNDPEDFHEADIKESEVSEYGADVEDSASEPPNDRDQTEDNENEEEDEVTDTGSPDNKNFSGRDAYGENYLDPKEEPDNITEIHESGTKKRNKHPVLIACALIFFAVIASGAGIYMALHEMDRSFTDLIKVSKGAYEQEYRTLILKEMKAEEEDGKVIQTAKNENEAGNEVDQDSEGAADVSEETKEEKDQAASTDQSATDNEDDKATDSETEANEEERMELLGVGQLISALDAGESLPENISEGTVSTLETANGENAVQPINPYIDPSIYYPLAFSSVDDSYFADALFIGDSRLQGFGMYSGLASTYYCATGFQLYKYETTKVVPTSSGKVPIFSALEYDAYTKIYIKVGLNEMGGSIDAFLEKYAELIAKLREYEPRAIIYIHAILPVTASKSASDKTHNNHNINTLNERLKTFAVEQKAYYLDVGPYVSLEDGTLKPETTTDGIHLKAGYMDVWKEYLKSNAVVIK